MLEKDYSKLDKNSKIIFISAEFNRNFTEEMENINEKILQKR